MFKDRSDESAAPRLKLFLSEAKIVEESIGRSEVVAENRVLKSLELLGLVIDGRQNSSQVVSQGFSGKPDVIAHSFGTWLIGHILQDEMQRAPDDRLEFGRMILTGCILRPDFDWRPFRKAGLVEEVLNHYGTKDPIVPLAQPTIWDSGPSGRIGFTGDHVLNVRAVGYGHSDLFAVTKCVVDAQHVQPRDENRGGVRNLEHSYKKYWRPFFTLPASELSQIPDRSDPPTVWRRMPRPLQGTLFPFVALPLVSALVLIGLLWGGTTLAGAIPIIAWVTAVSAVGLLLLLCGLAIVGLWHRPTGRKPDGAA